MSDVVIRVENLSKLYHLGVSQERPSSLVGTALNVLSSPFRNFQRLRKLDTAGTLSNGRSEDEVEQEGLLWALRDVSFEVCRGEVLGVIGGNGAGKSTLLKILSRITDPTAGRVRMRGHVAALLEVGTGFNPELTGRENVYLNGTILGMTKREIDRQFEAIVDFAGVERFLDTPVKRYSSGMKVRLGFAVAAHLQPDILIVDEVLAVGDAEFQRKCLGKMHEVSTSEGRTVLFVSHNMGSVIELTSRCIMLEAGRITFNGEPAEAAHHYLVGKGGQNDENYWDLTDHPRPEWLQPEGRRHCEFTSVKLSSPEGGLVSGTPLEIRAKLHCKRKLSRLEFMVSISNSSGVRLITCHSTDIGVTGEAEDGDELTITARIEKPCLPPGEFLIELAVGSSSAPMLDAITQGLDFELTHDPNDAVLLRKRYRRPIGLRLPSTWDIASGTCSRVEAGDSGSLQS